MVSSVDIQASRGRIALCALLLVLVTAAVFAGALDLGTVEYDDPDYVTRNPHIAAGLSWEGIRWATTSSFAANWFPMTWLSHMLDHELWGLNLAGHHATSVALHLLNTVLLFSLLLRMTGKLARAGVVAALFALHPLHVESVVWLSERKDVLCAAFALAAAHIYVGYARAPSPLGMAGVALLLAASLASKPMSVSWPFVLLLLDFWPLGRIDQEVLFDSGRSIAERLRASQLLQLVLEKWPLFVLIAISSAITVSVQTGAIVTLEQFPLLQRIASVPYAYVTYIGMTLAPVEPVPIHVHPGREVPVGFGLAMGAVMIAATGWLVAQARRAPFALVGWLWFVGMLVPVIGILQVGSQLVADRYTYLPLIGLFVAATWAIADVLPGSKVGRGLGIAGAVLVLGACALGSRAQVPYWKDTVTLFARTVEVDPTNHLAHALLARGYEMRGEDEPALEHYAVAAQLRPYHHASLFAMGQRLVGEGRLQLALRAFEAELLAKPDVVAARLELATLRRRLGDIEGARRELELARGILPESPEIMENLALLEFSAGRLDEAEKRLNEALALDPDFASGHRSLAILRARAGRFADALGHAERALSLEPESAESRKLVEQLAEQVAGEGS